jgi:hypothetical protein
MSKPRPELGLPPAVREMSWEKGKPATVRVLPKAEARAWQAKMAALKEAKMAALEKQWEDSKGTDRHAVWEALNFGQIKIMPPWLFAALKQLLKSPPQNPSLHWGRWLLVREGKQQGLSLKKAYKYANNQCKEGTPYAAYAGKPGAMKKSYDIVQKARRGGKKQVAPFRS